MNKYLVNTTDKLVTLTDFYNGTVVAMFDKSMTHKLTEDKAIIVNDHYQPRKQETAVEINNRNKLLCVFINTNEEQFSGGLSR